MKRVLVGCEFSGVVRNAFTRAGWDAISCDLLPSETPGNHYQGDIRDLLNDPRGFDLFIAHPECTYLCNSGVRWLKDSADRWFKLFEAADFFLELWNAPIPHICIENPVMHKYARRLIGFKQTQIVQPWMFGHTQKKATGLFLKNLPCLVETDNVKVQTDALPMREQQKIFYEAPGENRWKNRSRTFQGIAAAMATQWTLKK